MKKVIWLASWYPTEEHPLPGDFIERHAKAVSIYLPVHVIHVSRIHDKNSRSALYTKEYKDYASLKSEINCYRVPRLFGIDLFISYCYSLLLYISRVKAFVHENGKPAFIHVHVTLRCGLVALYFKWVYKIPFIVSEHHGALLPGAEKSGGHIGYGTLLLMKMVLKNALAVTAVSDALRKGIEERFKVYRSFVVPNVVDVSIFNPAKEKQESAVKTFLHVSTLSPVKNVDMMLKAFALVKEKYGCDFYFKIVGPDTHSLKRLSRELYIADKVQWLQETDQNGLAKIMQQADAAILYSSYESFGCINIEANAAGTPVIVSDIPTFREYLKDGINAVFVPANNIERLANAIANFIKGKYVFDQKIISASATNFSFSTVGKMFFELYRGIAISNQ